MRTYFTACRDWQLPVLLGSMRRHCGAFRLVVFAWDWDPDWHAYDRAEVHFITRAEFLVRHPEYAQPPGPPRKTINLIDTCRWRVTADLIAGGRGPVTYVDGDQWFFSSPEPMFEEIGDARLAVSPHRIPPRALGLPGVCLETHRKFGLFNSGFSVVADLGIAEEMAANVFRWSYSGSIEYPKGVYYFGDQGALEQVATRERAHVIRHPGVNVAPWNANCHRLEGRDGHLYVDDVPLVTYHFSGLDPGGQLANTEYCVPPEYVDLVYRPYLAEVNRCRTR